MKHMLQKVIKRFPPFLGPGLRPFAVFFLCTALFLGAGNAWGADYWNYYWVGNDSDWNDGKNWVVYDPSNNEIPYDINTDRKFGPQANGDVVVIPISPYKKKDGTEISFISFPEITTAIDLQKGNVGHGSGAVTIDPGASLTISGYLKCGKVTNEGTLINNGTLISAKYKDVESDTQSEGSIVNNSIFESTGTIEVKNKPGTISGAGTWNIGGTITTTGTQTYDGAVTIREATEIVTTGADVWITGTIGENGGNILFNNIVTLNNTLTITTTGGSSWITGGTGGSVEFKKPVTLRNNLRINTKGGAADSGTDGANGNITFGSTVDGTADLTIEPMTTEPGTITAGTVTLTGSWNNNSGKTATVDSITFTGTGMSEIKGINSFTNFTCTTPGKIISFPSTETSVNSFKVEGGASSYITLQGEGGNSWSLSFTGTTGTKTNPNLKFVSIKNAQLTGTSVFIYADKTRSLNYAPDSGNPSWTFDMGTLRTWEGSVSSTWGVAANWSDGLAPGLNDNIFIPTVSFPNSQPIIPTGGVQVAEAEISGNVAGTDKLTITGDMVISGTAEISALLAVTGTVTINAPGKDVVLNNSDNKFNGVVTVEQTKDISLTGTFTGGLEQKNGTGTTTLGQITLNSNGISIINNKLQITDLIQDAGFFFAQATDTTAPTIELGANVSATTSISFAGSVVLTNNLTLTAGSGGIIFNNVIKSASTGTGELTVTTGSTTGDITFGDTIGEGTPLATLTAIGAGKININGGSVTTTRAQTYTGAAVFSQNTTLTADGIKFEGTVTQIGGDKILTLNSSSVVTQKGTIDADSLLLLGNGPFHLAPIGNNINTLAAGTGTGTIRFTAAKDLTVGTVDTTAGITREGLVIIDGGTNKLTISQPVASSGNILLSTSTTSTTGSIALGANITATGSTASITLGVTTTLTSSVEVTSNDGTITFNKSINANSLGGQGLTITSKGITILNAPLGGTPLASFTKNGTGALQPGNNITTTGEQLYEGQVDLKVDTTFTTTNSDITFNSTIRSLDNNARSLTFQAGDGTVTFGEAVGDTSFPVSSLTKNGNGTTQINGGSVTTVNAQTYTGAVVFSSTNDTSFDASEIKFNSTLNPDAASTNKNVKIIARTGGITFDGAVGVTTPVGNFMCSSAGDIKFDSDFIQAESNPLPNLTIANGNAKVGTSKFIAGNIVLDNSSFTQTGNNGANEHSVGNISLDLGSSGMVWADGTTNTTGGTLKIKGTSVEDNSGHSSPIDFGFKNVTFATNITLNKLTLYDLTIPPNVTVTLNGPITVRRHVTIEDGGSYIHADNALTLGGTGTVDGTIKDENDGTSNPKQNFGVIEIEQNDTKKTFATDITAGTITCNAGSGAIVFKEKLTSTTKIALGNGSAPVTFEGEVSAVDIDLGGGSGAVTFEEKLTAIQLTNSGGIFKLFFNGGLNISDPDPTTINTTTINTTGLVTFGKTNHFEEGLHIVNAEVNLGLPSDPDFSLTTTSNDIIFEEAVTLSNVSKITILTGNGAITFTETIDGIDPNTSKLFLKAETGAVTFTGTVGATKPLESVNVHGNEIKINGGTVTTKGSQIYTGAVTIGDTTTPSPITTLTTTNSDVAFIGAVTLNKALTVNTDANAGNINFSSSINGAQDITLSAGTGNVIFGGAVGTQTIPLGSVTIQSASTALTGGVQIASHIYAADFVITTHSASNSNVYITGAAAFNIGSTVVTEINFPANLFIAAGKTGAMDNPVSFNKNVAVTENLVLFSGKVTFPQITTIEKDLVLLNGTDPDMYGTGNVYTYNGPQRKEKEASLTAFPQQVPSNTNADNAKIQSPYTGEVDSLNDKTITVNQNFYTNGVDLPATANWTLHLKGNQNTTDAFAEAYNANVEYSQVASIDASYAWVAAANATNGGNNTEASSSQSGWAFNSKPAVVKENDAALQTGINLSGTYTVYDDVIRLEFFYTGTLESAYIQNDSNQIWDAATTLLRYNTGTTAALFSGAYTTADCSTKTTGQGNLSVFYVRTQPDDRWNTDATGTAPGDSNSTDCGRPGTAPAHHSTLPSITFTENNLLKDIFKNRIKTETNFNTADRCRPVVVEVRTGQEVHKPFADQKPYDAHNFIEIRYSEPVTIPQFSDPNLTEYVKSQNVSSQTAAGGAIKQNGAGLDITGFANLETGTVDTGAGGTKDNTVHALYRNFTFDGTESVNPADSAQPHRVRISIAGWTDTKGATGYEYPGYIDNAATPSGKVTVFANRNIKDLSTAFTDGNPLEPTNDTDTADNTGYGLNRDTNHPKAAITVNKADSVLYGSWDIAPPGVSRFDWYDEKNGYEIVGNSNAAGYVGNFEFHFFDNTPDYPKTPPGGTTWLYSRGWGDLSNPIRPDTVGGSRPEYVKTPTSPKTQGGLRAATITANTVKNAFLLHLAEQKSNIGFDGTFERFITLNNFFGDETQPLSVTDDTLYLSLKPARTDLRSRETYDVVYDSSKGYITDLAGNRLKSAIWRTIDRTPPKISMTVTPYDDTRLFVFFNKKIELEPLPSAQNAVLSNIHQEFLFFNKFIDPALDPDASLAISDLRATKAELVFHTEDATGLILTLSRKVNYTELSTAFISLKKHTDLQDITGPVPAASNITDKKYNWMNWNDRIPVTYFGVNTIKPLYATDGMVQTGGDKKEGTTVVIRGDFDGSGQLYYDREISMQVRLADGVMPQTVPDVFIDAKPNPDSVSVTFNKNSGKNLSFWLPNLPDFPYQLISPSMNTHAVKLATGTGSGQVYTFKIPVNSPEREPGDTLQFIFRHGEIMTPDRITGQLIVPTPFYHIRLNNAQDPSELSLFAFNVLSMLRQRGGSTILNNVIQAGSEEAVLEVIMPKQGNLTVSVMTLDGNVIKHLHHGTASAGTHYLRWNGTNASGRSVARGMYFVRIIGPNIDETRKIMVVKD